MLAIEVHIMPNMDGDTKAAAYRFVGYAALSFSAVAVLSICVTLPVVYNYIHHVRASVHHELMECREEANNIYRDVNIIPDMPMPTSNRTARQSGLDNPDYCKGCCLPGPQGPPGPPGRPGKP
ncbi:unnamed protein product, partial [Cylicostephanus goldi]